VGWGVTGLQSPVTKLKFKKHRFVHMMVSNGFHNLPFGHNQLMTGTSTFCEIKLKKPYNVLDEIKRIQEDQAL
jgi:hypothetical protein